MTSSIIVNLSSEVLLQQYSDFLLAFGWNKRDLTGQVYVGGQIWFQPDGRWSASARCT